MYAFLLVLSVVSTAVGIFAIGFGIPNHEFGLGNTLIVSGAVAVVGGIVTFGLAVAVRQLRRIADAMGPRPAPAPRRQPVPESAESAPAPRRPPGPPGPPIPYPPRPDTREPRPEVRLPAAPTMDMPEPPPAERPRPNIFGVARSGGDPPEMEEPEIVPLAPNRMPAAPIGRGGPPAAPEPMSPHEPRPAPEPRPASPADIMARLANLAASPPRPAPPQRSEPPQRPEPRAPVPAERPGPAEQRPRGNMFDTLWPAEGRAARSSQSESIARAPKPEARTEPKVDVKPEPKVDIRPDPKPETRPEIRPELRFEPPMSREPMMPPPADQRPIAILKSGVIDGMAYTLYTDGSIEAELPQGTMRFGSIEELRAHLEKTERPD
jgi:hypothetical protein